VSEVHSYELVEAAGMWREANAMGRAAEEMEEQAKEVFLRHARTTPRFTCDGVKVSYSGEKRRDFISKDRVREVFGEEGLAKVVSQSRPYQDIRITLAGEGKWNIPAAIG